LFVKKRA